MCEYQMMAEEDMWKNRSEGMRCHSCMSYVKKEVPVGGMGIGRCRRHAPTLQGWPVVYPTDWCGDHKLNERKT
jgi:hypothetical protein